MISWLKSHMWLYLSHLKDRIESNLSWKLFWIAYSFSVTVENVRIDLNVDSVQEILLIQEKKRYYWVHYLVDRLNVV